jgi:hypothetical protein
MPACRSDPLAGKESSLVSAITVVFRDGVKKLHGSKTIPKNL